MSSDTKDRNDADDANNANGPKLPGSRTRSQFRGNNLNKFLASTTSSTCPTTWNTSTTTMSRKCRSTSSPTPTDGTVDGTGTETAGPSDVKQSYSTCAADIQTFWHPNMSCGADCLGYLRKHNPKLQRCHLETCAQPASNLTLPSMFAKIPKGIRMRIKEAATTEASSCFLLPEWIKLYRYRYS